MPATDRQGEIIQLAKYSESFGAALLKRREKMLQLLPEGVRPEKMVGSIVLSMQENPQLARCSKYTLMASALEAARLGLEVGGKSQHAFMIPYKGNATFVLGYKGALILARRSGQVGAINSYPVFEGEDFDWYFDDEGEHFRHRPSYDHGSAADYNNLVAAWASAKVRVGDVWDVQREVVLRKKIDAVRNTSRSKNGPWKTYPVEMAVKTAILRLCKKLPLEAEAQARINQELRTEAGFDPEPVEVSAEVTDFIDATFDESTGEASPEEHEAMEAYFAEKEKTDG